MVWILLGLLVMVRLSTTGKLILPLPSSIAIDKIEVRLTF